MTKFTTFGAIINEFYGILQGGTIMERKISILPDQDKFFDN